MSHQRLLPAAHTVVWILCTAVFLSTCSCCVAEHASGHLNLANNDCYLILTANPPRLSTRDQQALRRGLLSQASSTLRYYEVSLLRGAVWQGNTAHLWQLSEVDRLVVQAARRCRRCHCRTSCRSCNDTGFAAAAAHAAPVWTKMLVSMLGSSLSL